LKYTLGVAFKYLANYDFQQPFVPGGADIAAFTIPSYVLK
jgi:hypothetical protein